MKKILITLSIFLSFFFIQENISLAAESSSCKDLVGSETNLSGMLSGCLTAKKIVGGSESGFTEDLRIEGGFKTMINNWIKNISAVLFLLTVFAVVYAGLMMTLSAGEDEKIKKAKDIIKWSLLGFLGLISAGAIIALVINVFFSF